MKAKSEVRTTCPRDCYDACGVLVKTSEAGEVSVVGDPDHPVSRGALCGKCSIGYNGAWRDRNQRLLRPLRRTGAKGTGRFEPVSWETALADIAARLDDILETSGSQSILHTHYTGTCSLIAGNFPSRFFNRIGATEVDPDTVCNKAGHVALQLMYGTSTLGFDPRTAKDARAIMVWGANPSATAPHIDRYWLGGFTGMKIVVDPVRHATAAAADIHLQPFPGTDGALAFAMIHAIGKAGLIDRAFLAKYASGFEQVEAELDRSTPEWAESVTGVPASLIVKAALAYAQGPSLLWLGQGFQRQTYGGNAMRAAALLPAVTGNLGRKGAGFLYLNGSDTRGIDTAYLAAPHLNRGKPNSISHMDLARILETPRARALITWNNNIAASSPEQARLRTALKRDDLFQVTLDLFATDTTDFADYVLPAASFLEFDDLVMSYFNCSVSAQAKALDPPGEALPNQEIFRRLAGAMGLDDEELHETDQSLIATLLRQAKAGLSFAELVQRGTIDVPLEPVVQFERLVFPTPAGKIRIADQCFVAAGLPEAPFPSAEPRPARGDFRLLSPASLWLMNSSFGNEPKVLRQIGEQVYMNEGDAADRSLHDGDRMELSNATGALSATVAISQNVPAGVLLLHKSRWPKNDASHTNVNILNPGKKADLAESCAVHSIDVAITHAGASRRRRP